MLKIPKRAIEYGMEMKKLGLKGPAPKLSLENIGVLSWSGEVTLFQIGRRRPENILLLVRKGFGTIYAKPIYTGYRKAYSSVFSDSLLERDIDHLGPKLTTNRNEYIALGNIDLVINRSQKARESAGEMVMKAMNEKGTGASRLAPSPRAAELGRFVQNGYIRPLDELKTGHLKQITIDQNNLTFKLVN